MSSYRPRRTRIYGANYDIGESYYKKQLEGLDNKLGKSRATSVGFDLRDEPSNPKVSFSDDFNEDLLFKPKATRALDYKSLLGEIDIDEPTPVSRPFKSKFRISDAANEFDYGEDLQKDIVKKSYNFSAETKKSSFLNDLDTEANDRYLSRRLKIRSENLFDDDNSLIAHEASSRMKATKARLADLESEMLCITDKQNEREKRNSRLKKLLSESNVDAPL